MPIPNKDIVNAPQGIDPRARAAEGITDLILLDREVRVAAVVHNPLTFDADKRLALSGTSKFSNAASDPVITITDALDVPLYRPNIGVIGRRAFTILSRHPKILQATRMIGGDDGRHRDAPGHRRALRTGRPVRRREPSQHGAQRADGEPHADVERQPRAHLPGSAVDADDERHEPPDVRLHGSVRQPHRRTRWRTKTSACAAAQRVRVGESVREQVCAPSLGYLITDLV